MADAEQQVLACWGKTDRSQVGPPTRWHPALFHMLDVGSVTCEYLARVATPARLRSLASPLGCSLEEAPELLGFLAALHDLGKISPGFQAKCPTLAAHQDRLPYPLDGEANHALSSGFSLAREVGPYFGWPAKAAKQLAHSVAAHHGSFFDSVWPGGDERFGGSGWADLRCHAVRMLAAAFEVEPTALSTLSSLPWSWVVDFAGLVSTSDWVGSDATLFGLTPPDQGATVYAALARQRATAALAHLDWGGWKPGSATPPFQSVFGFTPNGLQQQLERAAERRTPGLLIIEAPMGLGKTEAALRAADLLVEGIGHAGIYFALPTQATSKQLFRRMVGFLERRYGAQSLEVHLLHAHSDLNDDYRALQPGDVADPDSSSRGAARAGEWFRARKRGLLAEFGVGTIDQALIGALQSRHFFVRLYGLGQKVVILDEIHAYDAYTSTLIERLVEWLGALGCSVLVLSATLPQARRAALVRAYGGKSAVLPATAAYPRLTVVSQSGETQEEPVDGGASRTVRLQMREFQPGSVNDTVAVAVEVDQRLRDGGCAIWIRNTVAEAQCAFEAIRDQPGLADATLLLLHARFPISRRLALENEVMTRFGKAGERPRKAVLVGTQVLEQSLDLDADWMITDLAPADLVLQRMGRLQRHRERDETRPEAFKGQAELLVLSPPTPSSGTAFGPSGWVYQPFVLERSREVLAAQTVISLPEDIERLVEAVYGPESSDAGLLAQELRAEYERALYTDEAKARSVFLPPPNHPVFVDALKHALPDEADAAYGQHLKTRLIEPSVTLVCLHQFHGRLYLDPQFTHPAPGGGLKQADAQKLLRASVSVSRPSFVYTVKVEEHQPPGWGESSWLRGCIQVVFTDGRAEVAGHALELDETLGLRIRG